MDSDQPTTSSPEAWFNQIDAPSPPPGNNSSKLRRWILIAIGGMVVLITGTVLFLNLRDTTCFKPENYTGLVNLVATNNGGYLAVTELVPGEPMYFHEVRFNEGSTSFDTAQTEDPTPFLQSLGNYYQTKHSSAPFTVRLETQYSTNDTTALAKQRLGKVSAILIRSGLDRSEVSVKKPTPAPTDRNSLVSDDAIDGFPVTLSVVPTLPKNCVAY